MPSAEFFSKFGLKAYRNFLNEDSCRQLCGEIKEAKKEKGIFRNILTGKDTLDEKAKKRSEVEELDSGLAGEITRKLINLKNEIGRQYSCELTDVQTLRFCYYQTGDFYGIHKDGGEHENNTGPARQRKFSAIILLNEESPEPEKGKYCGGNLTFYGLNQHEAFARFGLPLIGEKGMLITFPPPLPHEVTPVTFGERYSVATWFI